MYMIILKDEYKIKIKKNTKKKFSLGTDYKINLIEKMKAKFI